MTPADAQRLILRRARALALATREEHPDAPLRIATRIDPRSPSDGLHAPWTCSVTVYQGGVVVLHVEGRGDDPLAALLAAPVALEAKVRDVIARLDAALATEVDGADLVSPPEPEPEPPPAADTARRPRRARGGAASTTTTPQLSLSSTTKDSP